MERLREIRRRARRSRQLVLAVTVGIFLALALGTFLVQPPVRKHDGGQPSENVAASADDRSDAADSAPRGGSRARSETRRNAADGDSAHAASVGSGRAAQEAVRPVPLQYLPAGSRIIIHLRPAELWKTDRQSDELRACLKPVAEWGAKILREISTFEPAQIEEATFGVLLKGQGEPPEIAAVIRLVDEADRDSLTARFSGDARHEAAGAIVKVAAANRAILLADSRTIAVAPKSLEREMSEAAETPNPTDPAIEDLISHTDRSRQFTMVCRPDDVQLYREVLVGPAAGELVRHVVDWLDPTSVEALAWSVRVGDVLDSRVLLRNRSGVWPRELQQALRARLDELPRRMVSIVEAMNPSDAGRRRIMGRFPAMLKAGALATRDEAAERVIAWNTILPERAAPNLALAAVLTWDESRRARSTGEVAARGPSPAPVSIVERLNKPIVVDFRRTPLHEALAFISEEIQVPIELDGDGLKRSGYTRNMPQSLQMGTVPAKKCLAAILKQYDQMVVLIDEEQERIRVTVRSVAEARGIKPLDLPP